MPPLSASNIVRKENFFQRMFGGFFAKNSNVQTLMPEPEKRPQPQLAGGFVTELNDPRLMWIQKKLEVESDRLSTLTDIRIMLEDASYVDGPADTFCRWATGGDINFTFEGGSTAKAKRIIGDFLERIEYNNDLRSDLLYNAIFLELFIKQQIVFSDDFMGLMSNLDLQKMMDALKRGMTIGRINEILTPAPETMFRNSNEQDRFDNPRQAFYQVPEPYNKSNYFTSTGQKSQFQEWFHSLFIIHPRWNHKRQKNQRYSRPALKSARKAFNRTELSTTDAVIQRHLTASRLLIIYLKKNVATGEEPGVDSDVIENYAQEFIKKYPTGFNKPGTVLFESGANEVDSVGELNITLSKPADIFMQLELLFLGYLFPAGLVGYSGGEGSRASGPLLEQLKKALEVNIDTVNKFEDNKIFLPLVNMELALNGIFDTVVKVNHSTPSFDSKSVTKKSDVTEVEMGIRRRKTYYEKYIMPETGVPWEEYFKGIQDEMKILQPLMTTKSPFGDKGQQIEGANKGQSGSKATPETTPTT
jgi:hypothetical protein